MMIIAQVQHLNQLRNKEDYLSQNGIKLLHDWAKPNIQDMKKDEKTQRYPRPIWD